MRELNLYRLWEICDILSRKENELSQKDIWVSLLGNHSDFSAYSFEQFLEYYSFKIEEDTIVVFNTNPIPYESCTNNDFSYVPIPLLGFGEKEIEKYIEDEVEKRLEKQQEQKIAEKENIIRQIEHLTKRLNNL